MNNTNYIPTREGRIYTGVAEELERVPEKFRPDMALRIMRLLSGSATLEEAAEGLDWGAYNWLSRIADEADISETRFEINSARGSKGGRPAKIDQAELKRLINAGYTNAQLATHFGVNVRNVEKAKAALKATVKTTGETGETGGKTTGETTGESKNINKKEGNAGAGVAYGSPDPVASQETENWLTPEQIDAMLQAKSTSPAGQKKG